MIVPVVFSLAPYNENLIAGWMYYKSISFSAPHGWPVFAQAQYYTNRAGLERMNLLWEANQNNFDYTYSEADEDRYIHEVFPQELVDAFVAAHPSQTDAYLASLTTPWPQMTEWLVTRIRADEALTGEKTEALICVHAPRFVKDAAAALGVPILHVEWGSFRSPYYRNTASLDLTGNICDFDIQAEYQAFCARKEELSILSRREILALMLKDEYLHYAAEEYPLPEYEAGVICGYSVPYAYSGLNGATNAEMIVRAHEKFGRDGKIAVRFHPGDPLRSTVAGDAMPDCNLIDFILKAKRILGISSNVTYEAMLFGRPAYDLGATQIRHFANTSLTALEDRIASDDFLCFIAFCFFAPWELLKDTAYLRWRLSRPDMAEIYLYHLRYYLNCLGIPESVLEQKGAERLNALLACRGQAPCALTDEEATPIWLKTDETSRLILRMEHMKLQREKAEQALRQLQAALDQRQSDLEQTRAALQEKQYALDLAQASLRQVNSAMDQARAQADGGQSALAQSQEQLYQAQRALVMARDELTQLRKAHAQEWARAESLSSRLKQVLNSRWYKLGAPLRKAAGKLNKRRKS